MAEELDKKKVTALSELTTVSDNDLYITGEGGQAPLRKISFGTIAEAIKNKLLTWTFNALNTSTKTLTGSINELNSSAMKVTAPTNLASNTDLLSLVAGEYTATAAVSATLVNSPVSGTNFKLTVYMRTVDRKNFELVDLNGNIYINCQTAASTYTGWKKQPTRTEVDALNSNSVICRTTTATDFNNFPNNSWVWANNTSNTYTNAPATSAFHVMTIQNGGYYKAQIAIGYANSGVYVRTNAGSSWTIWKAFSFV